MTDGSAEVAEPLHKGMAHGAQVAREGREAAETEEAELMEVLG
jgi:hypothetical protein